MTDVFISYSRKDKPFVQRLHQSLEAEGRDAWVDWEGIPLTADWWAEIQEGIETADTFVFVISPDSAASKVCGQEVIHAHQHNKRIVPIVYRDVSPTDLPEILAHLNWVFCRDSDDFDRAFKTLIDTMDTDLEWVKAHTRLTQRAVEWDRKSRDVSYLLRGVDLEEAEDHLKQTGKQPPLTNLQIEYILSSRQNQETERQKEIEAQKQRRTATRRILIIGILLGLTVLIFILGYLGTLPALQTISETDDVRFPTTLASASARTNLIRMLADVRGYLALGEGFYRDSYNQNLQAFEADLAELEVLSPALSPADQERVKELKVTFEEWRELPELLFELRDDRLEREPAYRVLQTDGIKLGGPILIDARSLIERQVQREPTPEIIQQLADIAGFQVYFTAALSALRSYTTTRDRIFRMEYEANLAESQHFWQKLHDNRDTLTPEQQAILDNMAQNLEEFFRIPDLVFEIVESDRWREDLYLFSTEGTPLDNNMQQLLDEIMAAQQDLLSANVNEARTNLTGANQQTLMVGSIVIIVGLATIGIEIYGSSLKERWQKISSRKIAQFKKGL